ncbi:MAG: molybdenum cofactor guanylyltransferase [Myxococcales bacterium]|nr:molybdenum cofactor guanylyltransferase [Myxococcales bacterium]
MAQRAEFPHIAAAVLAGGESKRLGRDKALLPWGRGTLLEHVVAILRPLFDELVVVSRDRERLAHLDVPVVTDRLRGAHALAGIHAALSEAPRELVFVCACDLPLLSADAVRLVCRHAAPQTVVVPRIGGRLEPLFALYPRTLASEAEQLARAENYRLRDLVTRGSMHELDDTQFRDAGIPLDVFANINTIEDLEAVRSRHLAASHG